MAAGLIASLIPLLDTVAAGTAAKGTMDMNKKKDESKILDDGLLASSKKTKTDNNRKDGRPLSQKEKDELMIDLVMAGLSTGEAVKVVNGSVDLAVDPGMIEALRKRAIYNKEHGLPLLTGIGPNGIEPPEDDDDDKPKSEKDKKIDEENRKNLTKNANQNNSSDVKNSIKRKDASDAWTKKNGGKRITATEDKVQSLRKGEKAMADNNRFDNGQAKADKEMRIQEKIKAQDAYEKATTAPKFN